MSILYSFDKHPTGSLRICVFVSYTSSSLPVVANSCSVRERTAKTHQPLTDHPYHSVPFCSHPLGRAQLRNPETHETTTSSLISLFVLRLTLYVSFKCVCRKLLSVARYNISKRYYLFHVLFSSLEEFGKTKHYLSRRLKQMQSGGSLLPNL